MMSDLISRAAAIEYLMTNMGWHDEDGYSVDDSDEKYAIITDLVNGIPAVDAVQVVHSRWALVGFHKGMKVMQCYICGNRAIGATMFCPNCGAKMDG